MSFLSLLLFITFVSASHQPLPRANGLDTRKSTTPSFGTSPTTLKLSRRAPRGRWNIRRDPLGGGDEYMHYSSFVHSAVDTANNNAAINLDTDLTDSQLVQIATEAFDDMIDDLRSETNLPVHKWPGVVSALQVNNQIFLSSSIKNLRNGFIFHFRSTPVSFALQRCGATGSDLPAIERFTADGTVHRTGGGCGEVSAVHLFYDKNEHYRDPTGNDRLPAGARIVTVGVTSSSNGAVVVMPPCGGGNTPPPQWGCHSFLRMLGVRWVRSNTQPQPVPQDWSFPEDHACL